MPQRFLGLLLGAHEEDRVAVGHGVDDELVRAVEQLDRVLQVDDVDAVARAEDERTHLRVPALGLVAEVHTGLQQLTHGDGGLVRGLLHRIHLFLLGLWRPVYLTTQGRRRESGRIYHAYGGMTRGG
jgi:hypothetical protein